MNGDSFQLRKPQPVRNTVGPACGRKSCFSLYIDEAGELSYPDSVGM